MKKMFCSICCLLLAFLFIQGISAEDKEKKVYEGYTQSIAENELGFYLRVNGDESTSQLVYCFANGKLQPPKLEDNVQLVQYYEKAFEDDKGYTALLYAGYPLNQTSLMQKYELSNEVAHKETQSALWTLQNADLSVYLQYREPFPSYYVELLNYAANHVETVYDDYELRYYVSDSTVYQDMLALEFAPEENEGEDDKCDTCVVPPKDIDDSNVSDLQFYLFVGVALLLIVIVVIWRLVRNRRCNSRCNSECNRNCD